MKQLLAATLTIFVFLTMSSSALAAVRFTRIYFDPAGEDAAPEPNSDLNKERVVICNNGNRRRSLSRWKLTDRGADHRFTFPRGFRLGGGRCVRVHTGRGRNDRNDLYFDLDFYVWNNDGDRATLKKRSGTVIDRCGYGSGASSPASC